MRRAISLSVVLILLPCCCPFALGQSGSVTWPHWSGMPPTPRSAHQGPLWQHQYAEGFQSANAGGVGSGAAQLITAAGLQLQSHNAHIAQLQMGNVFVGQEAHKMGAGAGSAGADQNVTAGQYQTASSPFVGQATQNQSAAVTQHAYVSGAPGSTAVAGGGVAISTSQSSVVTN